MGLRGRITRYELANKLKVYENRLNEVRCTRPNDEGHFQPAVRFRLDYANGGVRVETEDQARIVSERTTPRRLYDWMDAGIRTLEEVTRNVRR